MEYDRSAAPIVFVQMQRELLLKRKKRPYQKGFQKEIFLQKQT